MKKKIILLGIMLSGLIILAGCSNNSPKSILDNENKKNMISRDVIVQAKAWNFQVNNGDSQALNEIRVKKGEKVNLKGQSLDMGHGIGIPDYGINIKFDPNNVAETSFIANKEGEFDFMCTVYCGEGHKNHKGKLIVEE